MQDMKNIKKQKHFSEYTELNEYKFIRPDAKYDLKRVL